MEELCFSLSHAVRNLLAAYMPTKQAWEKRGFRINKAFKDESPRRAEEGCDDEYLEQEAARARAMGTADAEPV